MADFIPMGSISKSASPGGRIEKSSYRDQLPDYAGDWYRLYGDEYGLSQDLANKQNMDSARQQMDFQLFMSDTSHQREVNDLLRAGLNPVLSANNGASTGAGAYANVDTSSNSAKLAEKQLNKQLENQRLIEKQKLDTEKQIAEQNRLNQYQIAQDQLKSQEFISKYNADLGFQLGQLQSENNLRGTMYSADTAHDASIYSTDRNFENSSIQRDWQSREYKNERDWSTEEAKKQRIWQGKQNKYDRNVQKYGINMGYAGTVYYVSAVLFEQ